MTKNIMARLKQMAWYQALLITLVGSLFLGLPAHTSAAAGRLYTTPGSTTVKRGSTITVDVRVSGISTDAVEATVSYNPSFFRYMSTDATGSAFPIELPTSTTNNSVTITRGIFAPDIVNSDSLVTRVTFKVLNRTTTTTLKLTGNATYQGVYVNPTLSSTTVRIRY